MKAVVIRFPGSNCDRDMYVALSKTQGISSVDYVWHKETALPQKTDLVTLPGGFSYGDYLRCGAIAARSPIMKAVKNFGNEGGYVLGICNGFQILTEAGLLPGALMQNATTRFICKSSRISVSTTNSHFTNGFQKDAVIALPIAHHEGNYQADDDILETLQSEDRIAFRYIDNPNGSARGIAGIFSGNRRVLGMMPHPERFCDKNLGSDIGQVLFDSLAAA